MKKPLIIVESPTKIKTLKKFLGDRFLFASSVGHIRDLPQKEFGVDIDNDFEPKYVLMQDKEEVIGKLKKLAKEASEVYLSPDPDREGEAIAWHILQILPQGIPTKRVSFHAITKSAVEEALSHPRAVDMNLVNAQQARRLLDRLVGYSISPILNRKIQRGRQGYVSGGRVQSVALKLVVEREEEIEVFTPQEYWNITAVLTSQEVRMLFDAYLLRIDGVRVEKEPTTKHPYILLDSEEAATRVYDALREQTFVVKKVDKKEKKRNPVPPFITSTLQQEASRHYGFSSSRTMSVAQSLYEGVELGSQGPVGLITYMRTDSVRVEPEALHQVRRYIKGRFGDDYLPPSANHYATKKQAQDAHEAIRPTDCYKTPQEVAPYLSQDQLKLYTLIWRRLVASQMVAAVYDTVSADIGAGEYLLRATGSQQKFPGFLAVYQEKQDDQDEERQKGEENLLPELTEGETLRLEDLLKEQAFTRPPPRFTEASLVKELEKSGIGRPSTYASIMSKIQSRDYTTKEKGRLQPTELGRVICSLMKSSFSQIMAIDFTKQMEDALERVADQGEDWKELLRSFWTGFAPSLEAAKEEAHVPKLLTDIPCPTCQEGRLQKVWSKSKYFYGCNRYPECPFTSPLEQLHFNKEEYNKDFDWDQPCPKCGKEMKVRHGRFGPFLGCSQYPDCKGIVNVPKEGEEVMEESNLPACPAKGCSGQLRQRRSRFGKLFFSCSTYPDCDVIMNDLEEIGTKYADHPRTAYVKKTKKGTKSTKETKTASKKKTGAKKSVSSPKSKRVMPEKKLSPAMQKFMGQEMAQRQVVLKAVWDHIKTHGLQNPDNKRQILPDPTLASLFSVQEPFDMMKIAGLISPHLL